MPVDLSKLALEADRVNDRAKWSPRSLVENERAEPYPVGALPPVVRDAVNEVAGYVQAPLALIAACALSAVSTAVQTRFSVRRDAALCGPATLYLLTVAESGERKSTVDNKFTAPIRAWEAKQKKDHKEKLARYNAEIEDWERQGHELKQNIEGGFIREQLGTPLDPRVIHELAKPKEPCLRRLLRSDDTPEALAISLQAYPVASLVSAEAGVIFGSHGMSADSVTRNLAQANVMWDGGVIHQERQGRGITHVESMRVTMGLQVQPVVLDNFVQKTGGLAKGIGYFARFLFSRPESTQGTRYYIEPPIDQPALAAFSTRMATLLDMEAQFDEYDHLLPLYIEFDAEAYELWMAFHDEVEELMGGEDTYSGIRDVASKAADNAARLACCLHVFDADPAPRIGSRAMLGACRLMRWYLGEAVRFARTRDMGQEVGHAQLLEEWLVTQVKRRARAGADVLVSVNEARKMGPNSLRGGGKLDTAIELLKDFDRLRVFRRTGAKGFDLLLAPAVLREYD